MFSLRAHIDRLRNSRRPRFQMGWARGKHHRNVGLSSQGYLLLNAEASSVWTQRQVQCQRQTGRTKIPAHLHTLPGAWRLAS